MRIAVRISTPEMALVTSASHRMDEYKRAGELIIHQQYHRRTLSSSFHSLQFLSNDIMKFKIACVLLLAVAAQTQFIGGYTGYPSLLPAATSLQWLPQGQPFPSIFNPVYPYQFVNYRGIAVGSAGAPWYFYNPSASYPQTVQVSADVKDADANTGAAGSTRTRRQIQLRYGSGRRGRSLNEMIEPETSPDTQWKSVDSAPSRTKRQIQLRYGSGRRGRSLNEMTEPETDGGDYESVTFNDPSRAKRQIQLRYRSGYGGYRRGRSLNEPVQSGVQFELDRAKRQIQLRYRSSARRRLHGRSLDTLWTTA